MSDLTAEADLLQNHAGILAGWGVLREAVRAHTVNRCIAEIPVPSQEEQQQELIGFWARKQVPPRQRRAWLEKQGMTRQDLLQMMAHRLRWQRWCANQWENKVEALFLKHKDQLDSITAQVLRVEEEGLARELYLQLQEGESDFDAVVQGHCLGSSERRGQRIGPKPMRGVETQLAALLRVAPIGRWQEPQQLRKSWVVLQVEERLSQRLDDPVVCQKLPQLEGEAWLNEQIEAQLKLLRAGLQPAAA